MGVRRQAREAALQAVFMCDFNANWSRQALEFYFSYFCVPKAVRYYAEKLVFGLVSRLEEIDLKITCASSHWSINRMGRVDRSIIRIAVYEMLYICDVPKSVIINEAIEIAKRYGPSESPGFVNGVLDCVAEQHKSQLEFEGLSLKEEFSLEESESFESYPEDDSPEAKHIRLLAGGR